MGAASLVTPEGEEDSVAVEEGGTIESVAVSAAEVPEETSEVPSSGELDSTELLGAGVDSEYSPEGEVEAELPDEDVPISGELDPMVVPGVSVDSEYSPERVALEVSDEEVPSSGELESIVVPGTAVDSEYDAECVALETSDDEVPSSGELESIVVPVVSVALAEPSWEVEPLVTPAVPVDSVPEAAGVLEAPCSVSSQVSDEALLSAPELSAPELSADVKVGPAVSVDSGLGMVMYVVTALAVPVDPAPEDVPEPAEALPPGLELVPDPVGTEPLETSEVPISGEELSMVVRADEVTDAQP